ncbi:ABC transporter ATP-binding protein [Brockia lithotrophica]|uniref:ATP-binding cassette subfamily B protein n=1 Tax=Brockia lithotrophica TaxID=933949 RepID=A0A660L4I8_9BACL|nr:ABC transporter ATP-binding protein [Brockia lithotrophica]RKQ88951.1 ATP-binding cassette subfamily B protein [Brockia lithotrophica]
MFTWEAAGRAEKGRGLAARPVRSLVVRELRRSFWEVLAIVGFTLAGVTAELSLPSLFARLVDEGVARGDAAVVAATGGEMLFATLLALAFQVTSGLFASRFASRFGMHVRAEVFRRIVHLPFGEYRRFGAATLLTRATNDVGQLQQVLYLGLRPFLRAPITAAVGLVLAFRLNARLALLLLASLPVVLAFLYVLSRRAIPLYTEVQLRIDALNRAVRSYLGGVRVARAFVRDAQEAERIARASADLREVSVRVSRIMALLSPAITFALNATIVLLLFVGARFVERGSLAVGSLIAFVQYAVFLLGAFLTLGMLFFLLPRALVSAERLDELLRAPEERVDAAEEGMPGGAEEATRGAKGWEAVSHAERGGEGFAEEFAARESPSPPELAFVEVSYRAPGAERPQLENFHMRIPAGAFVAVVGGTGSGKSTLLRLLLRFYPDYQGSVLWDGVDIREVPLRAYRRWIAYVPQRPYLFRGTVRDNLLYGLPEGEEVSDDALVAALEAACAWEFVAERPGGLDAPVEAGGRNFSGGQRQRLAIARALVRRAPLVLFDDAFSALDAATEERVLANLRSVLRGATVLLVTGRVSVARRADFVVVLEAGRVVATGTHDELLAASPVYRDLFASRRIAEGGEGA